MPSDSTERVLSDEEVAALREETKAFLLDEGISRPEAAREAGIHYATFSAWLNGTYAGRNDRVAADVKKWVAARMERAAARAAMPEAPRFIVTPTAEAITSVLLHARAAADLVVVSGPPGIGKTSAACQFTRRTPNVWKIVGHPMLRSPRAALEELARIAGLMNERGLANVHRSIVQRVRGTGGLIIVDEANHLSSEALDQLRSVHDEADVGLALMGNAMVFSRLEGGGGRQAEFAQLFSRVGMRLTSAKDHRARLSGDIDAYLDAWEVTDAPVRKLLHAIGRKPGALRNVRKVLSLSHMLAGAARETLGPRHVTLAWQRLAETAAEPGAAGEAA